MENKQKTEKIKKKTSNEVHEFSFLPFFIYLLLFVSYPLVAFVSVGNIKLLDFSFR